MPSLGVHSPWYRRSELLLCASLLVGHAKPSLEWVTEGTLVSTFPPLESERSEKRSKRETHVQSTTLLSPPIQNSNEGSLIPTSITYAKGQTKSKRFFQVDVSLKKPTKEFYFTIMKPQVDSFSFVFWRKLKTRKRHFEIN